MTVAGRSDSLVRNAVLAGVVLSSTPATRHGVGQKVGDRFGRVLASWDPRHAYRHVLVLGREGLVERTGPESAGRFRATADGVRAWRQWLVSPIDSRDPMRDALLRLRSCRAEDFDTMAIVIDLLEESMLGVMEQPGPPADRELTELLADDVQRETAAATLRWCQKARDGISAARSRGST